jgi:hypothetical protein
MGTYSAQNAGERDLFENYIVGLLRISLNDKSQVPGHIDSGWTGFCTRGWSFGNKLLGRDGTKWPDDIEDRNAIRTHGLTSAAGSTGPWKWRIGDLIDEVELHMPENPPDVEILHTRDGARRTTGPALLTGSKHLHVTKFF